MEKNRTIKINPLPVPTWNWMKMNAAEMTLKSVRAGRLEPRIENSDGVVFSDDAGGFDKIETGCGSNSDILFASKEASPLVITAPKGKKIASPVVLHYDCGKKESSVCAQIIRAEEGAEITVIIVSRSDEGTAGTFALRTLIFAEKNAVVHVVKAQLLGKNTANVDDTGIRAEENAAVTAAHIILGGGETFTGLAAALDGYKAEFTSDAAYLCTGAQKLDMNFVVRHVGRSTNSFMYVTGSLYGSAHKTYRGTIDLKKGCAGSDGEEQEETLLLSPLAVNKSIPMILCGEEDVAGEHGATIGRLGDDVLFYMQSRGFSKREAENTVARSKVAAAIASVPDKKVQEEIADYLDGVFNDEC
ncbi:MAG: SufD family Fe-S cluster assembly protein [Treponema sp.]